MLCRCIHQRCKELDVRKLSLVLTMDKSKLPFGWNAKCSIKALQRERESRQTLNLRQNSAFWDNFCLALKQHPPTCLGVCCTLENIFVWSPDRPRSHLADLIFPVPPFLTWLIGHPRRLHALSWPPNCHRQDFNSRQIRVIRLRWRPFDQHACLYKSSQTEGMTTKKASFPVWSGLDRWGIYLGRQDAAQCILGFHQCILAMIGPL